MNFCNLDYIPKIPAKPRKLVSKKIFGTFWGPHQCSGTHFSKFPRTIGTKTLFNTIDPMENRPAKSHRILWSSFCKPCSPILRIWRGHSAKSGAKLEKVRLLLDSGWGRVCYSSIKPGLAQLRIYFIFSIFEISKIRPSPPGGRRGMGSCRALQRRSGKVPCKFHAPSSNTAGDISF